MLLKNFRFGLILMVYAIILLFCNSLYNSYLSANELIIYEKQGFSSKFQDINSTELDLKNFEGKLILVNLWATWCEPCKEEMPSLDKLAVDQNFQNLKILPVNIGQEKINKIEEFYNKTKIKNLDIFYDTDVRLAKKFLLRGVPTTLIVSKDGKEFARVVGSIDFQDESFKTWLQAFD